METPPGGRRLGRLGDLSTGPGSRQSGGWRVRAPPPEPPMVQPLGRVPAWVLTLSLSALTAACGGGTGGSGGGPEPKERVTTLPSLAPLDGALVGGLVSSARPDLLPQAGGAFAGFVFGCVAFDLGA